MRSVIITSVLLLVGCGQVSDYTQHSTDELPTDTTIDPRLAPLLDEFLADAQLHRQTTLTLDSLIYDELTPGLAGVCRWWSRGNKSYRKVVIDPDTLSGEWDLKGLLWHEFGHCLLNKEHTETGMMRSWIYTNQEYKENWNTLEREFWAQEDK